MTSRPITILTAAAAIALLLADCVGLGAKLA